MHKRQWLCLVLGIALLAPALAAVHEELSYTTYSSAQLAGRTVRQSLRAVSPIKEGNQVFLGHTKWHVSWKFRWWRANQTCKITSVDVNVKATITLPELLDADEATQAKFAVYLQALRSHELGHYQHALTIGREIDRAILALPTFDNCAALESRANQLGYKILADHRLDDAEYDARTEHGKTQGASLNF